MEYHLTPRNKVKRIPKRGHYDQQTIFEILDAGFLCHVGFSMDGQPFVIPTAYGREGEVIYLHGATTSRMLRAPTDGGALLHHRHAPRRAGAGPLGLPPLDELPLSCSVRYRYFAGRRRKDACPGGRLRADPQGPLGGEPFADC
jgi:hypothetical protein